MADFINDLKFLVILAVTEKGGKPHSYGKYIGYFLAK
jgi:hypothetical protein